MSLIHHEGTKRVLFCLLVTLKHSRSDITRSVHSMPESVECTKYGRFAFSLVGFYISRW